MGDEIPQAPQIEWEGNIPRHIDSGDIYFSRRGGRSESDGIFLAGNDTARRITLGARPGAKRRWFGVAEFGFGTGLNLCALLSLWKRLRPNNFSLFYYTFEQAPMSAPDIRRALGHFPGLDSAAELWLDGYSRLPRIHGSFVLPLGQIGFLHLFFGPAQQTFDDFQRALGRGLSRGFPKSPDTQNTFNSHHRHQAYGAPVDIWFLDGFDPVKNPDLWTPALLEQAARTTRPGGGAATYTASALVRRRLTQAGYTVKRRPGFAGKKHMLTAQRVRTSSPGKSKTQALPGQETDPVLIIGTGLAGAHVAYFLKQMGIASVLIESQGQTTAGASGNPWAMLRLPPGAGHRPSPAVTAWGFASAFYRFVGPQAAQCEIQDSNSIYLNSRQTTTVSYNLSGREFKNSGRPEATAQSYIEYSQDLALRPRALGQWLIEQSQAKTLIDTEVATLTYLPHQSGPSTSTRQGRWVLKTKGGQLIGQSDRIIFCPGSGLPMLDFGSTEHNQFGDFRINHGSFTRLIDLKNAPVQTNFFGHGYFLQLSDGAWFGGTAIDSPAPKDLVAAESILKEKLIEDFGRAGMRTPIPGNVLERRVGSRLVSPDRYPVCGRIPDSAWWQTWFKRKDGWVAFQRKFGGRLPEAAFMPGLYVLGALGSRGLLYTPLMAAQLAANVAGIPLMDDSLSDQFGPERFMLRRLRRGAGMQPSPPN